MGLLEELLFSLIFEDFYSRQLPPNKLLIDGMMHVVYLKFGGV